MADDTSNKKPHGITRLRSKLEQSISAGNFYEAHQLYRTIYFRYLRQSKYVELLKILYDGALVLLNNKQYTSGADLANLYVDVLTKSKTEPSEEYISKISQLFGLIGKETTERDIFLTTSIQWSSKGENKMGDPRLHQQVAQVFWNEKNYTMARRHFLHSKDGNGFATMLVELHRASGYSSEVDLFIAQVVFQCLCLDNKNTAVIIFKCYTTQHPCIDKGPPYLLPLLNFIWFLFQAIDSGRVTVFTVLCEQYELSIKRDPSYVEYLDKIGQKFFGVPPPRSNQRGGYLGNLFQSLMNGVDDYDSSDEDDGRGDGSRVGSLHQSRASTSKAMEVESLD